MKTITQSIIRYVGKALMAAFMITTLSCERDLFLTDGDNYAGYRKVRLSVAYELPEHPQNAVTRSIDANDEYKLNNFYLMVFDDTKKCVFKHLYELDGGEIYNPLSYSSEKGVMISIEEKYRNTEDADKINTTSGYVVVEPTIDPTKGCYIFGFANVEPLRNDASSLDALAIDGFDNNGDPILITPREKLDKIDRLDDLLEMQVELNNLTESVEEGGVETLADHSVVNREHPNLLYSGQWSTWLEKRTGEDGKKHNVFDQEALSGFVKPETLAAAAYGGSYDLRKVGMVFLRTTIAHIRFNITINSEIFSDFKPESWQVVHLPLRAYFIDEIKGVDAEGNYIRKYLSGEKDFGKITPMPRMLHDEAKFEFDFYMMENVKKATDTEHIDYNGADKSHIRDYYNGYFGPTVSDNTPVYLTDPDATNSADKYKPSKQKIIYDDDQTMIRYAKREMELKHASDEDNTEIKNKMIWNKTGEASTSNDGDRYRYDSKKYVYSEPKASYVIIKGRLLIKDNATGLKNLLEIPHYGADNVLEDITEGEDMNIKNGYADVTYTVHLGYTKKTPDSSEYDEADFSVFRNAEYTYNIHIQGINSIISNVQSSVFKRKDDSSELYRVKPLTNAEGHLNLAMNKVYNTDAHFNQFNIMLEKSGLSNFYFEIHTPWSTISSEQVKEDIQYLKNNVYNVPSNPEDPGYATAYGDFMAGYTSSDVYLKYLDNPDFTWYHFTPAVDQRGMFDQDRRTAADTSDPGPYFEDKEEEYTQKRKTVKYDKTSPTFWNLFDFMVQMDGLSASDKQNPLYNEGITLADGETESSDSYKNRVAEAIKKRINKVLYGFEEGKAKKDDLQATVFECEVDDANGNYTYSRDTHNALPFLLDIIEYQLQDDEGEGGKTAEEKYNYLYDLWYANQSKSYGETGFYHKFKRPFKKKDETYWVQEDYVQYLKETDAETFGSNAQIAPIRRMFYTVYLDEYFYDNPPYDVMPPYHNANPQRRADWDWNNATAVKWKNFVNQPSRYLNFGYKGDGEYGVIGTNYSSDRQSSLMYSAITLIQPSIQTFYNSEKGSDTTYALGLEHYNETFDPRWTDEKETIPTSGLSHDDGWENCKQYISGSDGKGIAGLWNKYVSELVYEDHNSVNGIQNNVTMRSSEKDVNNEITDADRMRDQGIVNDGKLAYLAGAIRMCLNRNRDEDNDGKIDKDELKWYLPAANQIDIASMCHYSLYDPLFNYNDFFTYAGDLNHQRLPEGYLRAQWLYKYHFVTSDYMILLAEEFMNSSVYNASPNANFTSHPYNMRCVRNLNQDLSNATPTETRNGMTVVTDAVKVFTFKEKGKNGNTASTFEMNKLDSRSIRNLIYHGRELPSPHYLYSTDNLPYLKFQIATENDRLKDIIDNLSNHTYLKNIFELSPCSNYWEDDIKEKGSWRAPNAAELGLMMVQLRMEQPEASGNLKEGDNPKFFWKDAHDYYPFSSTSWNFTGPWGRVYGLKWSSGWDLFMSDIAGLNANLGWPNISNTEDFSDQSNTTKFFVRCVRDLSEEDEVGD